MYESFVIEKEEHDTNFLEFVKLGIYRETSGRINMDNLSIELNEDSFRNVFIYNNQEINIQKISLKSYKVNIYEIGDYDFNDIDINFGCELETCLDLSCIKPYTIDIKNKLYRLKKEVNDNIRKELWVDLLIIYLEKIVLPILNDKFIKRFPKGYIALEPKTGYVDYEIDFNAKIIYKIDTIANLNKFITFTRDMSLLCDDTTKPELFVKKDPRVVKNTLHCEIVTPTLQNIDDLKIIYNNIVNPDCFHTNFSTSFHINVSYTKPIYFTSTLIDIILKQFKEYESYYYRSLNDNKETKYAFRVYESVIKYIINKYGDMIYHGDDFNKRFTYKNFIEGKEYYRSYIDLSEKYNSIHLKSNTLLEFRLFSSSKDVKKLIEYMYSSKKFILNAYEIYSKNKHILSKELQKINIQTKIDFKPLESYVGKIYYEKENLPELSELDDIENQDDLNKALGFLFRKRNQKFLEVVNLGKYYSILTAYNGKRYYYNMVINNGNVQILISEIK